MTEDARTEAAARAMFAIGNERTDRTQTWDDAPDLRAIYLAEAEKVLAAADAVSVPPDAAFLPVDFGEHGRPLPDETYYIRVGDQDAVVVERARAGSVSEYQQIAPEVET